MDWLYVLPLYHFLKEYSEPFTPIPIGPEIQWTFWKKITDNKINFQRYLSDRYPRRYIHVDHDSAYFTCVCRFVNFWATFADEMKLDPVLMKVLLFICPEDQLTDVLSRVPPLLGISFVMYLFSKKKFNKIEDVHIL